MRLYAWLMVIVWLSHGCTIYAVPPEATRTSPHEWECTYAFSDTTCREMITAWAEDTGIQFSDVLQFKPCSDCQRRELIGAYATRYLIGYDCANRDGHDRRFAPLDDPVRVYKNARNRGEGWKVDDWGFHRCLLSWRCAQSCAIDFDQAVCVPLSGYYVGRWMPVMGQSCEDDETIVPESDKARESEMIPLRETHWHGLDDLPESYR